MGGTGVPMAWTEIWGIRVPMGMGSDGGYQGAHGRWKRGDIEVSMGMGRWGVPGCPWAWGGRSVGASGFGRWGFPGHQVFRGARSGGARSEGAGLRDSHVPWHTGAAPTLDGEGGPVLRLPARGAGPAHVHSLRPPCQLRYPAGTQPGCGTLRRGQAVVGPTTLFPAPPYRSTPSRTLWVGGSSPPSFSHSRRARGSPETAQANSAVPPTPLTMLPGVTRTVKGPLTASSASPASPGRVAKPGWYPAPWASPARGVPGVEGLTMDSHAGKGLGGADAVGDEAAVGASVGGQRRADAEEAGAVDDARREAAVDLVPSVEQRWGAVGQALHLQRVASAHRGLLRQAAGVRRRCGHGRCRQCPGAAGMG